MAESSGASFKIRDSIKNDAPSAASKTTYTLRPVTPRHAKENPS